MSKSKQQTATAAQRREQVRKQRQHRQNASQSAQAQSRNRNSRRGKSNKGTWYLIGGILIMVAVVIGLFVFLSRQPASTSTSSGNDEVWKTITNVNPQLLATVGSGGDATKNLMKPIPANAQIPKGPTGKPQFLYMGADYCPYCASQRWAIVVALSRFGTFSPLERIQSSESNVPTFSFHNSTYTSKYIDFVGLETTDNQGNTLDQPSAEQLQLIKTYDAPPYTDSAGTIPFIMIANQQVSTGAYYSPQSLIGLSYEDIAGQVTDPNSTISKGMLGSANYLTAAICAATDNQPENVCKADPIPAIQQTLPKASATSGTAQTGIMSGDMALIARRQD